MSTRPPAQPLIYLCPHGEHRIGEAVTPVCDQCRKPLPTSYDRARCETAGCKRNTNSIKERKWPGPLCPACGRAVNNNS